MYKFFSSLVLSICFGSLAMAQHSDVLFGYDDLSNPTRIEIDQEDTTNEGIQFHYTSIETIFGDLFAPNPGFASEDPAAGLILNPGDKISLRVLDAASSSATNLGVGYVNFYDPNGSGSLQAAGEFVLSNLGTPSPLAGLELNGDQIPAGSGDNPVFIKTADANGVVHHHLVFDLVQDGNAAEGAYGFLVQLESELAVANAAGELTVSSDPFWLIINNGLATADFEGPALAAFGVGVAPACLLGDVDLSGAVDFSDIGPFIGLLSNGTFQCEADCDGDNSVSFQDIGPFIQILSGP